MIKFVDIYFDMVFCLYFLYHLNVLLDNLYPISVLEIVCVSSKLGNYITVNSCIGIYSSKALQEEIYVFRVTCQQNNIKLVTSDLFFSNIN